MTKAKTR